MKMRLVPLLLIPILLVGFTYAADEKKSDKSEKKEKRDKSDKSEKSDDLDPQTQKLRDEFGLARLIFLRQTAKEAEIDQSMRDDLVKVCDDTRNEILSAVEQEKAQPSEPEDQKQLVKDLSDKFSGASWDVIKKDPNANEAINRQTKRLTYELELIRKGLLVDKMNDLDLTEEQKSAINELVDHAKKKVKAPTAEMVMKDEQSMTRLLDIRKKIREKLNDEQREQWKTYVAAHANEKRTLSETNSGS
jgi:hypothetical protein